MSVRNDFAMRQSFGEEDVQNLPSLRNPFEEGGFGVRGTRTDGAWGMIHFSNGFYQRNPSPGAGGATPSNDKKASLWN